MSLALLFHYLLLNMFRMLVHPSSGACNLLWIYLMRCIALVRCVLVLRCGSAGAVWYPYAGWSNSVLQPAHGYHTTQPNHTVTPAHIEPEWYTHTQSQAPEDECNSIRNMLSKKQSMWHQLVYLYSTIKMMHGPINIRLKNDQINVNTIAIRNILCIVTSQRTFHKL